MSQVIIEIGEAYSAGSSSVHSASSYTSEEITSSGTAQSTTINGSEGSLAFIANNGSDAIWVRMDGNDAAVGSGRFITPNTAREFGPLIGPVTISVINDS